ncbi:unnamed protein product [Soboliphyme baturini]|uniref:MFS domain-containing protein n=1 Tax=Soboliphyme baturini TaxID=241478 RepID=A0A183IWC5_9BILA|nr:unnamed protein product [Soboliphyme baturini]
MDTSDSKDSQNGKALPLQPVTGLVSYRWIVLILFCLLSMSNSFQWIEYATIGHIVTRYYNVSYSTIDWMSMIYMVCYIPLIMPATWVMDRYGLRLVVILGAFGNCLGSWVKCASSAPNRLAIGFFGQTIVGMSQIFILCVPPRLAAVWFGPTEVSLATSIGVFGNQVSFRDFLSVTSLWYFFACRTVDIMQLFYTSSETIFHLPRCIDRQIIRLRFGSFSKSSDKSV